MARVPNAEIQETRVTSELLAELPVPPSRRGYGQGDLIDGKFRLEALIGTGGMGEVWTASNDTLGVRRAVKLIRADSGSAESTDRLLHEAQAAARVADPAIVRVFDFGRTERGDPYIVMELLEGEDLMSIINRRERLSPVKAVRVLLPVIRALGAAHEHGIVHRDLKPENIFLARLPDGRVQPKLLDFGIAKLKNARDLRLTSAGSVMGSPLYMAPEQARGEDVDERADIWALCVVLYEAMTGQPPFRGDDRAQVMHAVATLDPEHPSERGVLEPAPWPILQHGLEKRRDERWRSMDELGRALARWLLDAGVSDDITGASLDAGWFRNSRRSLFASSLPPERSPGRGATAARRLLGEGSRRGRLMAHWLMALGARSWRRFERLDVVRRAALLAAIAALAIALIVFGSQRPVPAAQRGASPPVSTPSVSTPPVSTPPAAAPLAVPAPMPVEAGPSALSAPAQPPVSARSSEPTRAPTHAAARPTKARRTVARKPPRTSSSEPPRETATRARRAKLIDRYQSIRKGVRAIPCLGVLLLSGSAAQAKDPGPEGAHADARTARAAVGATGEGQRRTLATPDTGSPAEPARSPTEPPPADLTEQAKQLYLLGAEAFAAQRNADAIGYFRQAERLVPSAKLTYNIALAYDEMGDTGRALSAYRAFLAREPGSLHQEEVQARIAKFELALAALGVQQLSISSEPAGATLRVGEEIVGVTPWAGELTPGLHRIRLERPGYRTHEGQVALSAQHAGDLQVALQATSVEAPERPGTSARIQPLSWCFLGVGVAALAGGVGFELSRAASSERAGDAGTAEEVARAEGAADAKQMASLLLLGAGGAFVVAGGVLLVLDLNRDTAEAPRATDSVASARLSVPCAPGFCGVLAQGQF